MMANSIIYIVEGVIVRFEKRVRYEEDIINFMFGSYSVRV